MNWKKLFSPVKSMDAEKAKAFFRNHPSESYQLLDVRQPREYDSAHIPGAILIPLKELPERTRELDQSKPTVVYCAVGGRSFAASQYLLSQDFKEVYNLSGGIKAWHGEKASGPETTGFELLLGSVEFADAYSLAYAMEDELQKFYQGMADSFNQGSEQQKLFSRLVVFEEKHKEYLVQYCEKMNKDDCSIQQPPVSTGRILEGGYNLKNLNEAGFDTSLSSIIDMAMTMEAQAMDLYSRLSRTSESRQVGPFFLHLADEEKQHLSFLSRQLDEILEAGK
jgi:rhodanese-related sulfurtransferase/rubrerythrin